MKQVPQIQHGDDGSTEIEKSLQIARSKRYGSESARSVDHLLNVDYRESEFAPRKIERTVNLLIHSAHPSRISLRCSIHSTDLFDSVGARRPVHEDPAPLFAATL